MNGGHTVLVVDDDPAIRLLCRVNLELDGHTVAEAGSVGDARRALAETAVEIVLLDVQIGADDGIAFLRELRAEHPKLKVAMLTGSTTPERARAEQPDALIGKPFSIDDLRATVQRLGDRRVGLSAG